MSSRSPLRASTKRRRVSVLLGPTEYRRLQAIAACWATIPIIDDVAVNVEVENIVRCGIAERWRYRTERFQKMAHQWFRAAKGGMGDA